jgi:hypothetical protein
MTKKDLTSLTDEELLLEAKKMKKSEIISAFMIGFLIGIVIFSIAVNSWGLSMLIPLFIAYKLLKNPNNNQELKDILKERNLK